MAFFVLFSPPTVWETIHCQIGIKTLKDHKRRQLMKLKRTFAAAAAMVMAAAALAIPAGAEEFTYDTVTKDLTMEINDGDLNGDGDTDVTDLMKLAAHVKGLASLENTAAADLNSDGDTNVTDLMILAARVKSIRSIPAPACGENMKVYRGFHAEKDIKITLSSPEDEEPDSQELMLLGDEYVMDLKDGESGNKITLVKKDGKCYYTMPSDKTYYDITDSGDSYSDFAQTYLSAVLGYHLTYLGHRNEDGKASEVTEVYTFNDSIIYAYTFNSGVMTRIKIYEKDGTFHDTAVPVAGRTGNIVFPDFSEYTLIDR